MQRRNFLKWGAGAGVMTLTTVAGAANADFGSPTGMADVEETPAVRFRMGLCSDLHQDVAPGAAERLQAFVDAMHAENVDVIVQLGDFCCPRESNREIVEIWNSFRGVRHHVIGNHERDGGFSFEQVLRFFYGDAVPPQPYHSFDSHGYHFVLLSGNDPLSGVSGYARYIGEEQREWLRGDLCSTKLPILVFCHQGMDISLCGSGALEDATAIRYIFEQHNRACPNKVRLVFSGHHHSDFRNVINGIYYIQINSMTYSWTNNREYMRHRFSDELEKQYPCLANCIIYRDPIWATVTIYEDGSFAMCGRETDFLAPTPQEMGMECGGPTPVTATISDIPRTPMLPCPAPPNRVVEKTRNFFHA